MNKYQEALNNVKDTLTDLKDLDFVPYATTDDIKLIQELVDKETPMKPVFDADIKCGWFCPKCDYRLNTKYINYCPYCGQKLDWS